MILIILSLDLILLAYCWSALWCKVKHTTCEDMVTNRCGEMVLLHDQISYSLKVSWGPVKRNYCKLTSGLKELIHYQILPVRIVRNIWGLIGEILCWHQGPERKIMNYFSSRFLLPNVLFSNTATFHLSFMLVEFYRNLYPYWHPTRPYHFFWQSSIPSSLDEPVGLNKNVSHVWFWLIGLFWRG